MAAKNASQRCVRIEGSDWLQCAARPVVNYVDVPVLQFSDTDRIYHNWPHLICGRASTPVLTFSDTDSISRVSDENGISRLYIIVELYHSGRNLQYHPMWPHLICGRASTPLIIILCGLT